LKRALVFGALVLALSATSSAAVTKLITSRDIRNGTIQPIDLSPAAKKGMRGPRGLTGGIQDVRGYSTTIHIAPGQSGSTSTRCPEGQIPISGGATITGGYLWGSWRSGYAWIAAGTNINQYVAAELTAYAYCATLTP
jgi:hypothetical protein